MTGTNGTPYLGKVIGERYQIQRVVGTGAMGVVFAAHDPVLDREVAIKVLTRAGPDAGWRRTLIKEARILARFKHPNIVTVYDAGELEEGPYLVMELVEGRSLNERLPMDLDEMLRCIRPICGALSHAHRHGVIHRDLKPRNILFSSDDQPIITDFGIAHALNEMSDGEFSGTVYYMAPEQTSGQSPDARSDIYSLGVIMYQAVTGQLPFQADEPVAVIFQHRFEKVVPPIQVSPGVPKVLSDLIVRMLEKAPEDRPENVSTILDELKILQQEKDGQGMLSLWRDQGLEVLQPSTLLVIQKSAEEVDFEDQDIAFLLKSALYSELDLTPWLDMSRSRKLTLRVLEQVLSEGVEARIRDRVIDALETIQGPEAMDILLDLILHDPDPEIRSRAAITAARLGPHEEIASHLRFMWEEYGDSQALKTFSTLVEELGTPPGFGDYPRLRVWYDVIRRRWKKYRSIILKRALWAGIGAGVLQALNGSAAPLYTYMRSRADYYEGLKTLSLPAWIVISAAFFIVIGFVQGYTTCFLVSISDMFRRRNPELRRYLAGGVSGLAIGILLVMITTLAQEGQEPPVPAYVYNTVYIVYGLALGFALAPAVPPLREPVSFSARLPWLLLSTSLAIVVTIPYVYLVYADAAAGNLPVRLALGGLLPPGISAGIRFASGRKEVASDK